MTIISNIHYALFPWQTGYTYNVGDRVNSSGGAYSAISSGVSGSTAPSGTLNGRGASFNDGGVNWIYLSSVDYVSLIDWNRALPNTLTDHVVARIWNDGVITTADQVPFLKLAGKANGTSVSSPRGGTITDSVGNVWRMFGSGDTSNLPPFYVGKNGVKDLSTYGTLQIFYTNQTLYYQTPSAWFSYNGTGWVSAADPTAPMQRTSNGYTTTITAATRDTFQLNNSLPLAASSSGGVTFRLPASGVGGTNYFDIYDDLVTISNIQFIDPYVTVGGVGSNSTIINANSSTTLSIQNCIIDGYAQDKGATMVASSATLQMVNCLVVDRQGTGYNGVAISSGANNNNSYLSDCTIARINATDGTETLSSGYLANYSSSVVTNTLITGYTNPVGGNGNQVLVDHSGFTASRLAFAFDNGNNLYSISNPYVNATSDFRLQGGTSPVNAGIPRTTYNPTASDIFGYSRNGPSWSIGASEYVYQLIVVEPIVSFSASANITTTNIASSTNSIAPFTVSAGLQQFDGGSATVTLSPSLNASAYQYLTSSARISLGPPTTVGSAVQVNRTIALVSLGINSIVSAVQARYASATASLPVSAVVSAAITNGASGKAALAITAQNGVMGQSDNASALISVPLSIVAAASYSIDFASATVTMPITPSVAALQEDNTGVVASLGPLATVNSSMSQYDRASGIMTINPVASGTLRQDDLVASSLKLLPSVVVTAYQSDLATSLNSIVLTAQGTGGPTYTANAPQITLASFTATGTGLQNDTASIIASFAVSAVSTAANPVPAVARNTLGPITSLVSAAPSWVAASTNTVAQFKAIGLADSGRIATSVIALLTLPFSTGTATIANPLPCSGVVSVGAISTYNTVFANTTPLVATVASSIGAITVSSIASQEDRGSALLTLPITALTAIINAPRLRVSQIASEILASGGALRVSQTAAEVLSSGGALRVSQAAVEVLAQSPAASNARISQLVAEALATGSPRGLVSQSVQEVLAGGTGAQNVRMSQVTLETLTGGVINQNVFISQVVMETLISAVPLRRSSNTFYMV